MKLGIVVFANDSGLGNQTRRLTELLNPYRILVIDNSGFSKIKDQHFDWYDNFTGYKVHGFPSNQEVRVFLRGLTHVLVCENPLNFYLFKAAKMMGIKTYCQTNYEFCDNLANPALQRPDMFLMPSYWKVQEMKERFDSVLYLPPPIDPNEFKDARAKNMSRTGKTRFLHMVGTLAAHDRNGTLSVIHSLQHCKASFELVIHSQQQLPDEYKSDDPRITYSIGNVRDQQELYADFDALILPRRYGGLCLPMAEAMMSGLPVLMTDISPNNSVLPAHWLITAGKVGSFQARVPIDIYDADCNELAEKIDQFAGMDVLQKDAQKILAFDIAHNEYAPSQLAARYQGIW